ncbi:hypothetical protein GPECTOR_9g720 [Gonium pectorale]|uniref:Protein ENHANCED DISEASE RESISTANCE 2 C-terminal domain-containing protein n=1 Tax=Gonium pectorale TaxID=33097 RepID=A0A150GSC1_GONPE|nr:hypothetical protein GPECTOR_9g720 [Gonium pectorale]|eukprot:KXZ52674.1 hypothetical protein GPECTOR_9g720 [Gonium pectorale]
MLDRSCSILPQTPEELSPQRRGVRPKGTWAITAAVQGVTKYEQLYEITIDWPPSWAASGYTTLTLGFRERDQAERWHRALSDVMDGLRAAKGQARQGSSTKRMSELSTTSVPVISARADSMARAASGSNDKRAQSFKSSLRTASMDDSDPATDNSGVEAPAADLAHVADEEFDDAESDVEGDASGSDWEEEPAAEPTGEQERWVPYRQTNGVAIYRYAADGNKSGGGEFMVSCVIRGRPQRVAAALMRLRGNTTILGPAAHAEVLQPADGQGGAGKEILRLVLTAAGHTGFFCAPREVILERMRKDEEDGVCVIMFKSVDLPNEAASKGKADAYGSGLFRRPVRGIVAGGYTIAGLKGEGAASQESLITCIVKVDLGGACSEASWLSRLSSLAGWTDSFLERILMSVTLVRDEVEQRRFAVQPFKLVASAKARFNQAQLRQFRASAGGDLLGGGPASAAPIRSMSLAPPLSRMASMRLNSATAAEVAALAGGSFAVKAIPEEGAPGEDFQLDLEYVRSLALMPRKYWSEIHLPGTDAPFSVRGPTYLKDRKKVPAGRAAFGLGAMELVELPSAGASVEHVARYVPSIRQGGAPFSIIINLVIPGSPMLCLLAVFVCDKHPSILGEPPASPMDEQHDWQPFDFVLHKFVYGDDATRNSMLKLVPHIASGSWMIKQSVDIDISANSVANYVTGMVRGATASLDIDLGLCTAPWELPECLLGCLRLTRLDCKAAASKVDWSKELPLTAGNKGSKL